MTNIILIVLAAAFLLLFCLVMLIGIIGKGMTRSERLAAFGSGFASALLFILGLGGEF